MVELEGGGTNAIATIRQEKANDTINSQMELMSINAYPETDIDDLETVVDASLKTNLIETDEAAIGSNELDNAIANGMVLDDAGSNEAIATDMVIDKDGFNEAADTCTTCHKTLQNFIN